jgi:hypothetical protein
MSEQVEQLESAIKTSVDVRHLLEVLGNVLGPCAPSVIESSIRALAKQERDLYAVMKVVVIP